MIESCPFVHEAFQSDHGILKCEDLFKCDMSQTLTQKHTTDGSFSYHSMSSLVLVGIRNP